jgi:ATP-dependent exoDNAse (exonuclease V) alpha subunit
MKIILDTWIDLRPSFAQTVNKSQGSTYDIVMIDLNDICSKCRTLEQLARILYVALSRGRSRIIMTGDLRRK